MATRDSNSIDRRSGVTAAMHLSTALVWEFELREDADAS